MAETLDPGRSGLLVFDMLECYRGAIEEAGTLSSVSSLVAACRSVRVPVFYARADHRADGADFAKTVSDVDRHFRPYGPGNPIPTRPHDGSSSADVEVLHELAPRPGDYVVPKHRWSAFYGTHLELSLRSRGIDTLMLTGGSVHVGIASSVFAGRDMDFQLVVVRDGCHGHYEQRQFFMEKVFPRVCRVRTVSEVCHALRAGGS